MSLCNALSIVKKSPLEFTPHVDKQLAYQLAYRTGKILRPLKIKISQHLSSNFIVQTKDLAQPMYYCNTRKI